MEKQQRSKLQTATQDARKLLEEEFRSQLLQTYDIDVEKVRWAEEPGAHLQAEQRLIREKLIAWIEHKEAQINDRKEALLLALREMAFTALNRFVALKLMEARELVRPCVSGGLESAGFLEFTAVAQGLLADQESSYRLYLETIFEDVSCELRALFDPRDSASLLWPRRAALLELLDILNRPELDELWGGDETLGWVYQYFNGDAERKKMREESDAPRNSRELAVRNQFFTPRYVVEFLTDNTLGRIWYEMRQGNTALKECCHYLVQRPNEIWLQPREEAPAEKEVDDNLSQEELLQQPMHIQHRPLKDPREIRLLDPACGSMHFGLYAFDLYFEIYTEAWEIVQSSDEEARQEQVFTSFAEYAAGFADKATFLCEVPRLILLHNIHGIDIDHRATQIAQLTLWLRAQKAWNEQNISILARPQVKRSNIACAEPMPGEAELLADFVENEFPVEHAGIYLRLFQEVFGKMKQAGDAGSLLNIEEQIQDAISKASREWKRTAIHQKEIFSPNELANLGSTGMSTAEDIQALSIDFWNGLENRFYDTLKLYADQVESRMDYKRRLFVNDASQGFGFIELCMNSYDVILMNPPFGDCSLGAKGYIDSAYKHAKTDLGMAFVSRWSRHLNENGLPGAITNRVFIANEKLSKWRHSALLGGETLLDLMVDFGLGVLDAMVETAAYVISKARQTYSRPSVIFRVLSSREKEHSLQSLLSSGRDSSGSMHAVVSDAFSSIPSSIFCYWLPLSSVSLISGNSTIAEYGLQAKQGMASGDDFRFFRLWWEIPYQDIDTNGYSSSNGWVPLAKGGEYSPLIDDPHLLVDWRKAGEGIKSYVIKQYPYLKDDWGWVVKNSEYYFQRGLTYPARTASDFCPRILPAGSIFSAKGQAIIGASDDEVLLYLVGSFTRFYKSILDACLGSGDTSSSIGAAKDIRSGLLNQLPHPLPSHCVSPDMLNEIREAIKTARYLTSETETARYFSSPWRDSSCQDLDSEALARAKDICAFTSDMCSLNKRVELAQQSAFGISDGDWKQLCGLAGFHPVDYPERMDDIDEVRRLATLEDLDLVGECIQIYGASRQLTKKAYIANRKLELIAHASRTNVKTIASDTVVQDELAKCLLKDVAHAIVSYGIGLAFVHWSAEAGSSGRLTCFQPDIFSPLPQCAPGAAGYPDNHTSSGPAFLASESGGNASLLDRVRSWINDYSTGSANEEARICSALGESSVGDYISKPNGFFAAHFSQYSKSRRQAPMYWQLSAGSCQYSFWQYYHRLTSDTIFSVLRELIEPRIQQAEREQFELESQGALSGDAAARLKEARTLLQDLRILKGELELVAPLWNPNLNDGVIINHAILWRITPYTPWQKKCKECWDKLVKGDYDWAHLAFHLWPERVIPKCVTDRSLAIAHGLEERLWQETNNGNWLPRQLSEADLQALIAEHSNPAVKSALERFLAAPPPVAPARTRAPRATRSTASGTTRKPRGSTAVVDAEATRQTLLVLSAAPAEGLSRNAIAELLGVEAGSLTAVIKQLKATDQIEQLGAARGARYVLTEKGRAAVASQAGEDD